MRVSLQLKLTLLNKIYNVFDGVGKSNFEQCFNRNKRAIFMLWFSHW